MSWGHALWLFAVFFIATSAFIAYDWYRRRRDYRLKVGLDLDALIALLPAELRTKAFTHFLIGPRADQKKICVGLVYRDATMRSGNPANVGLEFDAQTGKLLNVVPEGIGLGLK